jgi:BirA family biotin operon repressor/biotin-[acetyl-CoA-carboxylase] ligase
MDHATVVVSGAKVAREIGVTRWTVWRWMEKLRSLGVRVKGHPMKGYQLERMPDILVPGQLQKQLRGASLGKRIHHFFKIDSTNNVAMNLGALDEPHGTIILAEEQTAGRGRVGRNWYSEKSSGIYMSVLLRPEISPVQAPLITLLAGLAVYDSVRESTGLQPDIRWPNDLLLQGKKFCGILTEMNAEPERVHFVAVGIGVNVNHAKMPEELVPTATSLRIVTSKSCSRLELLARLLRCLDRYYNQFLRQGPQLIIDQWCASSTYSEGKRVKVVAPAETFTGRTAGLDATGLLRVIGDDGRVQTVLAGDVLEI